MSDEPASPQKGPEPAEIGTLSDGRYRLRSLLGSGGMATVYEAWDSRLEVRRAIKLLNPALARNAQVTERFQREARTMAQLAHPHIARVLDVDRDGAKVFMVMELLPGGSLDQLVREHGPQSVERCVEICDQVLQALGCAHEQGVIHRDIKPHNVLLDAKGKSQVTDFGIARLPDGDASLTRTGAVLGTWMFMAPELRNDAKRASPASDLYAVGIMLYILLTAREPFDMFATNLHEEHFVGIPGPLRELLVTASRYHPGERFQAAEEMRSALAEALAAVCDPTATLEAEPTAPPPVPSEETFPLDVDVVSDATAATAMASTAMTAVEPTPPGPPAPPSPDVDPEAATDPRAAGAPTASFGTISHGDGGPVPAPRSHSHRWLALTGATLFLLLGTCAAGYSVAVHYLPAVLRGTSADAPADLAEPAPRPRRATAVAPEEPDAQTVAVADLTVTMSDDTFVTAAEVVCESGYRLRSAFGANRVSIVPSVPTSGDDCTLHFKGTAGSYGPVLGGQSLTCTIKQGVAGCY